jgi:enamine deaminase RidA (YjgF/YER057c/UK114 family)
MSSTEYDTTEYDTRAATAALRLDYLTRECLDSRPSSWWRNVLGVVGFSRPPAGCRTPIAVTMTPLLGNDPGVADSNARPTEREFCEVWRIGDAESHEPLVSGQLGRVQYRFSGDILFGCLSIDEGEFPASPGSLAPDAQGLLRAAESAYEEVFAVLETTQHQHLIRIWNYVPEINAPADGEERYRLFNSARQAAFVKWGRAIMGSSVPAACALGSPPGAAICIYFLASRRASMTIENPRQTSAYHYPPKFGKHSPIFSRACIFGGPQQANLFISGTSSIVGHDTLHRGDVEAQTGETLANIHALLDEANRLSGCKRFSMRTLKLKVYVRHAADLGAIRGVLAHELPADSCIYLLADICRDDLLMEIEAIGQSRMAIEAGDAQ